MRWLSTKSPGKLGRPISRQSKITSEKSARVYCRSSTLPRKTTDVVANTVVEKVFHTNCCNDPQNSVLFSADLE